MAEANVLCCTDEHKGLRYKGFSLVFMQTFVVPYGFEFDIEKAVGTEQSLVVLLRRY